MPYFQGVYGYEITKVVTLSDISIHPVYKNFKQAKKFARNKKHYHLTGIIEYQQNDTNISLYDLEAVLAFIDRLDVIITNRCDFKNINKAKKNIPNKLYIINRHSGGGRLIGSDTFFKKTNYREEFINSALNQLAKEPDDSVLRKSFFKTIETFRARRPFLEISYYLYFSALESLARFDLQDESSRNSSKPIAEFLQNLGFNLKQDNSKDLVRAVSSYTYIRNALFHNSKHEVNKKINDEIETFNINDFYSHLSLLVPLVILKYIGYDDGMIRWDSWHDRMSY